MAENKYLWRRTETDKEKMRRENDTLFNLAGGIFQSSRPR